MKPDTESENGVGINVGVEYSSGKHPWNSKSSTKKKREWEWEEYSQYSPCISLAQTGVKSSLSSISLPSTTRLRIKKNSATISSMPCGCTLLHTTACSAAQARTGRGWTGRGGGLGSTTVSKFWFGCGRICCGHVCVWCRYLVGVRVCVRFSSGMGSSGWPLEPTRALCLLVVRDCLWPGTSIPHVDCAKRR